MNLSPTNNLTLTNSPLTWILWIVLLGLILRLFQLGEWSFWHDEALTVLLADQPISDLISITAADVHPPFYFLLVKLFMLFGHSEFTVRLVSALSGVASVYSLYAVGKTLFDEKVGRVGAFILAISPLQLFYAQEARMYTLLLLLTIISSWCFIRALQDNRKLWWGIFIAVTTLSSYTAYFTFPVLAAMALYVFLVDKRREQMIHFLISVGIVAILYVPWMTVFLNQTRAVLDTYWIARPNPLMVFTTLSAFFISFTLPPLLIAISLAATLLIIFIVLNEVRHAFKAGADLQPLLWLLLWLFVPLLGTFLISLVRPIFQIRTVITAAPALYLLVAWGVARAPQRRLNSLFFGPTLVLMLISIFNFYFTPAFAKPTWRQAADYVNRQSQTGDVVVHTSDGSFLPFLTYQHNVPHTRLPVNPELARQNAPSQPIVAAVGGEPQPLDKAIEGYDRVWLVVGFDQSVEYQLGQKERFDARFKLLEETKIGGIHIFNYGLD